MESKINTLFKIISRSKKMGLDKSIKDEIKNLQTTLENLKKEIIFIKNNFICINYLSPITEKNIQLTTEIPCIYEFYSYIYSSFKYIFICDNEKVKNLFEETYKKYKETEEMIKELTND